MSLLIALQLYSVRDSMEKDFEGTLRAVKDMGYDGVEFAGLYGKTAQEVRALCNDIGLIPVSAHVPFTDLEKDPSGQAELYGQIGCMQVVIPYLTEEYRPGKKGFDDVISGAREIGKACKDKGMILAYHNHDFEFEKLDGKYALDILYSTVPAEYLQTQIDTCWANVGGVDPSQYILGYSGRCPTVHLKDFAGVKGEHMYSLIGIEKDKEAESASNPFEFRPCGCGVQDMKSIIEAGKKAGAKWFIVEQDMPSMGKTPLECAKISIDNLRKI